MAVKVTMEVVAEVRLPPWPCEKNYVEDVAYVCIATWIVILFFTLLSIYFLQLLFAVRSPHLLSIKVVLFHTAVVRVHMSSQMLRFHVTAARRKVQTTPTNWLHTLSLCLLGRTPLQLAHIMSRPERRGDR